MYEGEATVSVAVKENTCQGRMLKNPEAKETSNLDTVIYLEEELAKERLASSSSVGVILESMITISCSHW